MTAQLIRRRDDGRLRVGHCVGFYFPENVGGTEVYVRDLVEGLASCSIDQR